MGEYRERTVLDARLSDAVEKARKGSVATLPFLSPREARIAERGLNERGEFARAFFFGGYPTAERRTLFLLPDYLCDLLPSPAERTDEEVAALLGEDLTDAVSAVRITGSGFRALNHRDYLGAILNLGLERDAVGDLAVQNAREAVLFCSATVAKFLIENLIRVASDSVKVKACVPDADFTDGRHYRPISDTVASPRLDCVVAALTNLSREDAQDAIRTGLVEVEFEPIERTDLPLSPPVTLSIRGYGRFILRAFDGETKKGRLRMRADKVE